MQITVTNFAVDVQPASQTVAAGDSANYTVTITPQDGSYTNAITLACTGLPAETGCAFNPPAVTPGASPATSELTINTTPQPAMGAAWIRPFVGPTHGTPLIVICLVIAAWATLAWQGSRRVVDVALDLRHQKAMSVLPDIDQLRRLKTIDAKATAVMALAWLVIQFSCGASVTPAPAAPSARLTPASLAFDPQGVGTTSPAKAATLSNTGNASLSISGISTTGDFAQTNNCGASLAVGANCAINVTFMPTASGERTGTLSVANNASPRSTSLTGTGLAGTTAGTYPIGVTGTAGTLVNSGSVTLVVE